VSFRLKRRLTREQLLEQLRREAREGLTASPKRMRSRWVWDGRGSDLYARIMELPQYYLPQAEREILAARAPEIEALVHPRTVVELGPGSSVKTPLLLDGLSELDRYVAVDVSGEALEAAGGHLAARYPELEIVGVVGVRNRPAGALRTDPPRLPRLHHRRARPGGSRRPPLCRGPHVG
jgi:L-histidine N-alpha-methyltransferase